mmetsp:Transcript_7178/g.12982  ORF Transcript_7178/g.12982 Transcript_7178/m.12982 type:complete len:406 (+) Transcript_7178:829-2046(+)
MPGLRIAASRARPIPNTPSSTRRTAVRADRWSAGGLRHVQPIRGSQAGARTARSVPRLAGQHGAARQPGPDGLSVLLAGKVAAHGAHRLPGQRRDDPRGGHAGARHRHDLGRGRADLGGFADRGSPRRGLAPVAADAGHALRDPALHRARYVAARLPAPQGGAGSPAIHDGGHVDPRDDWAAPASLLVDQRVEGAGRCQGHALGAGADPAGLVLCGRARCRAGADHRSGVFPADGRDRAVAVPSGAQARRATAGRLAIRLPAPAPQVGQHGQALRLRLRPARPGGAAVATGLRPGHRAAGWRRAADVPARASRAVRGTGINGARPVDGLVLSGVPGVVLSGVGLSCYQACPSAAKPMLARVSASLNFPNLKHLTDSRSAAPRWTTTTLPEIQLQQPGFPTRRARP